MCIVLENDRLKATIRRHGAELVSLIKKETGAEYMWSADPAYWGRTAPILFPFVGKLKGLAYQYEGKSYPMGQHGFARDCDFTVLENTEHEAWFCLKADDETLSLYPFHFVLKLGYRLLENRLEVLWQVENADTKEMYFSIGGHPAFRCPLANGRQTDCYLAFDKKEPLNYNLIDENGLLDREGLLLNTCGGMMSVDAHLFDEDALIFEGGQLSRVSLCGPDKKPYLSVSFDTPLVGIWSPAKKQAPFICIEPWRGRCDRKDFDGQLSDREYGQKIAPGETFSNSYFIEVH